AGDVHVVGDHHRPAAPADVPGQVVAQEGVAVVRGVAAPAGGGRGGADDDAQAQGGGAPPVPGGVQAVGRDGHQAGPVLVAGADGGGDGAVALRPVVVAVDLVDGAAQAAVLAAQAEVGQVGGQLRLLHAAVVLAGPVARVDQVAGVDQAAR